MSLRLEPFTTKQTSILHDFHRNMYMGNNVCCTLSFDYGHNHARATYRLTSPQAGGSEINVSFTELRKGNQAFVYSVVCEVNGATYPEEIVLKTDRRYEGIPDRTLRIMQERMTALSKAVHFAAPAGSAGAEVADLMSRMGVKNG